MAFNEASWKGRNERDLIKNIHVLPFEVKKTGITLSSQGEEFLFALLIEENERITWYKIFELFDVNI